MSSLCVFKQYNLDGPNVYSVWAFIQMQLLISKKGIDVERLWGAFALNLTCVLVKVWQTCLHCQRLIFNGVILTDSPEFIEQRKSQHLLYSAQRTVMYVRGKNPWHFVLTKLAVPALALCQMIYHMFGPVCTLLSVERFMHKAEPLFEFCNITILRNTGNDYHDIKSKCGLIIAFLQIYFCLKNSTEMTVKHHQPVYFFLDDL